MTEPLNLKEIDASLRAFDAMAHGMDIPFTAEVRALLRALRETRTALQPFAHEGGGPFSGHSGQCGGCVARLVLEGVRDE